MSTISSLPNELLVAIVTAGQEHRFDSPDRYEYRWPTMASKPEWTVSHVSHRLRDIVVGAPSLWTLLEASLDTGGSAEILKLYLERSCASTIRLTLHVGFREITQSELNGIQPITERIREISQHLTRAGRLTIILWELSWNPLLLPQFLDIGAPDLQHFEVIVNTGNAHVGRTEIFSSAAPTKLSFLKMSGWTLPLPLPQWTASLTRLELRRGDSWTSAHNRALLTALTTQCPLLAHLHLDLDYIPSAPRVHFPALELLHISISDCGDDFYLLHIVDLFDTPTLTEFVINGTHGDQISRLFNQTSLPHASFPALSSFSFVVRGCDCETETELQSSFANYHTISSPPRALFPALSSLTLINQCFAPKLVEDLLGPASQPWPQLQTVTLCPMDGNLDGVCSALRDAANAKRQRGQTLPKLRLSSELLSLEDWREKGVDVEKFDPDDVLDLFRT
ncbi:hypothetical protein DFH06DRAFT_1484178 [Mycena polygramma]|nr:hypothetical protein DFH06DRAFT_1484178 [Mycena polygramma]